MTGMLDRDAPGDINRVQILIHPDPTSSPTGNQWADPTTQHRFLDVLGEVQRLGGTQILYDDLRSLQRTNTRLAWLDSLATSLDAGTAGRPHTSRDAAARAMAPVGWNLARGTATVGTVERREDGYFNRPDRGA